MSDILDIKQRIEKEKKVEKKQEDLRKRELSDIRKVISFPEGRRFMWRLWGEAGIYTDSFTGNSQTFYNEGRRSLGLMILRDVLEAEPKAFAQIQSEFVSEANSNKEEV